MRLATFSDDHRLQAGVLLDDGLVPVTSLDAGSDSVRGLLATLDADGLAALGQRAAKAGERLALEEVELLAPVPDAGKVICLGLNYRDHAAESGQDPPAAPMWFAKFANSLLGSGAPVVLPGAHPDFVDYEAELAVVIGRTARNVSATRALDHVAGAMPFNDVSARDLQFQNPLWTSGKAIDTFAPCGPALVTLDEIADLQELDLGTSINGEVVQSGNTREQVFAVAEVVAWLSRTLTLQPGDVIATGTPAGVGAASGRFLREGDLVEVTVQGLDTLANRITLEAPR